MAAVLNEPVSEELKELVPVEKLDVPAIFTGDALDPLLVSIEQRARSLVPDLSTTKGRAEVASMAYKVSRCKTFLDGAGKDFVAELKKQTAGVDEKRRIVRERLDALRDEVRKPLDAWEEERTKADNEIGRINGMATSPTPRSVDELEALLLDLMQVEPTDYCEEKRPQVEAARNQVLRILREQLADRREFEELKRKEEERQLIEEAYAENDRRDAELKAQKEREEQIRQEAAETARREAEEEARQARADEEARQKEARETLYNLRDYGVLPDFADLKFVEQRIQTFESSIVSRFSKWFSEDGHLSDFSDEYESAVITVRCQLENARTEHKEKAAAAARREKEQHAQIAINGLHRILANENLTSSRSIQIEIGMLDGLNADAIIESHRAEFNEVRATVRAKLVTMRDEKIAEETAKKDREEAEEKRRRDEAEEARRARDEEHRRKINNEAVDALVEHGAVLTRDDAKKVIELIARGKVNHVSIKY